MIWAIFAKFNVLEFLQPGQTCIIHGAVSCKVWWILTSLDKIRFRLICNVVTDFDSSLQQSFISFQRISPLLLLSTPLNKSEEFWTLPWTQSHCCRMRCWESSPQSAAPARSGQLSVYLEMINISDSPLWLHQDDSYLVHHLPMYPMLHWWVFSILTESSQSWPATICTNNFSTFYISTRAFMWNLNCFQYQIIY